MQKLGKPKAKATQGKSKSPSRSKSRSKSPSRVKSNRQNPGYGTGKSKTKTITIDQTAEERPLLGLDPETNETPLLNRFGTKVLNVKSLITLLGPTWVTIYDKLVESDEFKKSLTPKVAKMMKETDFRLPYQYLKQLGVKISPSRFSSSLDFSPEFEEDDREAICKNGTIITASQRIFLPCVYSMYYIKEKGVKYLDGLLISTVPDMFLLMSFNYDRKHGIELAISDMRTQLNFYGTETGVKEPSPSGKDCLKVSIDIYPTGNFEQIVLDAQKPNRSGHSNYGVNGQAMGFTVKGVVTGRYEPDGTPY